MSNSYYGQQPYPNQGYDYRSHDFVGAPPMGATAAEAQARARAIAVAAGVVVAGMIGVYLVHRATKNSPTRRRVQKAAMKMIGDEAKKTGRTITKHAGSAASALATNYIDDFVGRRGSISKPIKVSVLRSTPV